MTEEKALKLLKTDVQKWNQWRVKHGRPRAQLEGKDFSGVDLSGADLSRCHFHGTFNGLQFRGANLSHAVVNGVGEFHRTNFEGADLSGIRVNCGILAKPVRGIFEPWSYRRLPSDFTDANFTGANLFEADLRYLVLRRANFHEAQLNYTVLSSADLAWADFSAARLISTELSGATMDNADLTDATFSEVVLSTIDLRTVRGLESVKHLSPSSIGVETIYLSEGLIPQSFLRDAGVPEEFIRYIPSLIGARTGTRFYSCFISYSQPDEEFAQRLHGRMRQANLRVWYAPEDMKGGRKIHEQIETAIHLQDKLLLVLSEASMASEWVAHEIYTARQREKREKRQILSPIALCPYEQIRGWKSFDADTGKDMAREIREYLIPDFSRWKDHDKFEAAFTRLLRDLKTETLPDST